MRTFTSDLRYAMTQQLYPGLLLNNEDLHFRLKVSHDSSALPPVCCAIMRTFTSDLKVLSSEMDPAESRFIR
jgi:hypothetical protein